MLLVLAPTLDDFRAFTGGHPKEQCIHVRGTADLAGHPRGTRYATTGKWVKSTGYSIIGSYKAKNARLLPIARGFEELLRFCEDRGFVLDLELSD